MKYLNKTTADGLRWLDEKGATPHTDAEGLLTRPFILSVSYDSIDRVEKITFGAGSVLPQTPGAVDKQKLEVRAKAEKEVEQDWAEMEARQKVDTDARNARVIEARARNARRAPRPTVIDPGAVTGNSQGGTVAIASPAKPESSSKKKRTATKAATKAKPAGKAATRPPDGQPSKPENGQVYTRHMRNPHEAFILIKNPTVFGSESNWATKEEFKTAEDAVAWARKNGLKVLNAK